eukprot:56883_1
MFKYENYEEYSPVNNPFFRVRKDKYGRQDEQALKMAQLEYNTRNKNIHNAREEGKRYEDDDYNQNTIHPNMLEIWKAEQQNLMNNQQEQPPPKIKVTVVPHHLKPNQQQTHSYINVVPPHQQSIMHAHQLNVQPMQPNTTFDEMYDNLENIASRQIQSKRVEIMPLQNEYHTQQQQQHL